MVGTRKRVFEVGLRAASGLRAAYSSGPLGAGGSPPPAPHRPALAPQPEAGPPQGCRLGRTPREECLSQGCIQVAPNKDYWPRKRRQAIPTLDQTRSWMPQKLSRPIRRKGQSGIAKEPTVTELGRLSKLTWWGGV